MEVAMRAKRVTSWKVFMVTNLLMLTEYDRSEFC